MKACVVGEELIGQVVLALACDVERLGKVEVGMKELGQRRCKIVEKPACLGAGVWRGIPNKEASGIQGLGKGHDVVQADKTMRGSISKDAIDASRASYAAARVCAHGGVKPVVRCHRRTGAGARRGGILVAVAAGVEG
ncbi:unnamed protein product [Clonostachys solani]|uniref:Uncharacterized protein n=1 Tax=Clonostachys solani TaxID=160281 RepID=A0A9P0EP98_9HYPO|nr:unnamed protein product [Clonostachys solani]